MVLTAVPVWSESGVHVLFRCGAPESASLAFAEPASEVGPPPASPRRLESGDAAASASGSRIGPEAASRSEAPSNVGPEPRASLIEPSGFAAENASVAPSSWAPLSAEVPQAIRNAGKKTVVAMRRKGSAFRE